MDEAGGGLVLGVALGVDAAGGTIFGFGRVLLHPRGIILSKRLTVNHTAWNLVNSMPTFNKHDGDGIIDQAFKTWSSDIVNYDCQNVLRGRQTQSGALLLRCTWPMILIFPGGPSKVPASANYP